MGNVLKEKSFAFALHVVKLSQFLVVDKKEYVLSKQVLRSGAAIGALISEAEFAQSKPDFINKLSVGLKEANETYCWLKLLHEGKYISEPMFNSIQPQTKELIKLLVISIKTAKKTVKNE